MNHQSKFMVAAATSVLVATTSPSAAQTSPQRPNPGNVQPAPIARPKVDEQAIRAAFDRLVAATSTGTWAPTWDDQSSLLRIISGGPSRAFEGSPADAARGFVNDNAPLFAADRTGSDLKVADVVVLEENIHRVTLAQTFRNLPVVYADMRVVVDQQNRVTYAASTFWPVAADLAVEPALTSAQALERAGALMPLAQGAWEKATLSVYPRGDGVLAYVIERSLGENAVLPWELAIDAATGEVLESRTVIQQCQHKSASSSSEYDASNIGAATGHARPSLPRTNVTPSAAIGPPPDPCAKSWELNGPAGETLVLSPPGPIDLYDVIVVLGDSNVGSPEDATQDEAVYGAGITLLPGIHYTITFTWDMNTWDSYNATWGYWDVFFVHVNNLGFLWSHPLGVPEHLSSNSCGTSWTPFHEDLQGPLWTFGGDQHSDGDLCSSTGTFSFTYFEPDHLKTVYLSVGLDTFITGAIDGFMPSWGTVAIEIAGETMIFNPNPTTVLATGTLTDGADAASAVPTVAYDAVTLTNLTPPMGMEPWRLTGTYARLADKPTPQPPLPNPQNTPIPFTPPTSRTSVFPFLRDCDGFEAVMAYHHVTTNQLYIQSLGYATINNRQIDIDAHNLAEDNSFYVPAPLGAGYLAFGDGGVDDAEDADVIIHEYGHAIQDHQSPGAFLGSSNPTGLVNEARTLGEAFGDYWACSHFRFQNEFSGYDPALFADWDATNGSSPNGWRDISNSRVYPRDIVPSPPPTPPNPQNPEGNYHLTGQIWSGAMWDVQMALGKTYADKLALRTNALITTRPSFTDAAVATLAADGLLTGGVNKPGLAGGFMSRGIFRRMDVTSTPSGVPVGVSVTDVLGVGGGSTPLSRGFRHGQFLTVTAPATHSGRVFRYWQLDGVNLMMGATAIGFTMNDPSPPTLQLVRAAHAVYMIPGDVNGDNAVNITDLVAVITAWGACPANCPADLNNDGAVDISDLVAVITNWG